MGKEELRDLGFDVPVGKITALQFMASYRAGNQLPSMSEIAKADDIELQEIAENASRSIQQVKAEDLPLRELLGLDKQLRCIRGLLEVEVAKERFSWKNTSRKSNASSRESENILENTMMQ